MVSTPCWMQQNNQRSVLACVHLLVFMPVCVCLLVHLTVQVKNNQSLQESQVIQKHSYHAAAVK